MHRSDDAGKTWTEISEGLPTDFGFAAAAHPHDRDSFYVIPLQPGHGRTMPDGQAAVWRTRDAGSSWTKLTNGLPQQNAFVGVLREGMTADRDDAPGPLLRDEHRPAVRVAGRGRELERDRGLPARDLVGLGGDGRVAVAEVHLPGTLPPLFPGLPRRLDVDAATVGEAIDRLDEQWPGLSRPALRVAPEAPAAHQRLCGSRAGRPRHRARGRLPRRRDRRDQRRLEA